MSARRSRWSTVLWVWAALLGIGVLYVGVREIREAFTVAGPSPLSLADLDAGRPTPYSFSHSEPGGLVHASPIGPIQFHRGSGAGEAAESHKDLARAMRAVLALPSSQKKDADGWVWYAVPWVGGVLAAVDGTYAVVDGQVLSKAPVRDEVGGPPAYESDLSAMVAATEALLAEAGADDGMTPWMHGALTDLLERLDDEPGDPAYGELDSDFARRVVAQPGWLDAMAPHVPGATCLAVQTPLRRSLDVRVLRAFGSGEVRLEQLVNGWGPRGWLLRTSSTCLLIQAPPAPMDASGRAEVLNTCRILCEFPPAATPLAEGSTWADLRRATFARGGDVLATWSAAEGFTAAAKRWREAFPVDDGTYVRGGWPPHVPLRGPDGVLHGVAVPGGVLHSASDHAPKEVERFLADAARLLPDAPHLDLIQQYFLRYTFDSPAPDRPLMVGCEAHCGDLHQTAAQTLASCAGGVCRGDCDDIAELLQVIARRQGKLAHVIKLPGHLAMAWAERRGELWHVFVLQSGPSHEFWHAELPAALEAAYLRLDPHAPFDRHGVGVSLRFSGQNTRGDYGLSWRIFEDRAYADVMTDVQADWSRMTLLRAEMKMRAFVSAGVAGPAENGELAGLCRSMARYAEAAAYDRTVLDQTRDPESRVIVLAELIEELSDGGDEAKAGQWLKVLLDKELPALVSTIGLRALVSATDLAGSLAYRSPALAARLLAAVARLKADDVGVPLTALLGAGTQGADWREHEENEALQDLMVSYAWAAIQALERHPVEARDAKDMGVILPVLDRWLREFAFDGLDSPGQVSYRWALRAWRLPASLSERLEKTAGAEEPILSKRGEPNYAVLSRTATDEVIWSWARCSPAFFSSELSAHLVYDAPTPDPAVVRRLGRAMKNAVKAARRLGVYGRSAESSQRTVALRVALITQDKQVVRRILREVEALDDRDTHNEITRALGHVACHLPAPWWGTVVRGWLDEIGRPDYAFDLVWAAMGVRAPERALAAADLIAQQFPDEPALQEEVALLRKRLLK